MFMPFDQNNSYFWVEWGKDKSTEGDFEGTIPKSKFRGKYTYTIIERKEVLMRIYFQFERLREMERNMWKPLIYPGTQVK